MRCRETQLARQPARPASARHQRRGRAQGTGGSLFWNAPCTETAVSRNETGGRLVDEVKQIDEVAPVRRSRVQLAAVVSGTIVALASQTVLWVFSWAIGLASFSPTAEHLRGLALGNLVWGAIALWISLFFGAWTAATVGRSPSARDGIWHGIVVWGLVALAIGALIALACVQMRPPGPLAARVGGIGPTELLDLLGLTLWLYWGGMVGGFFTALAGGWFGARTEAHLRAGGRRRLGRGPIVPEPV
jgi:hypothetical protein